MYLLGVLTSIPPTLYLTTSIDHLRRSRLGCPHMTKDGNWLNKTHFDFN